MATAGMHLLRRFSRDGAGKLAAHAGGPCVCAERLKSGRSMSLFLSRCAELAVTAFSQFLVVFHVRLFAISALYEWLPRREQLLVATAPQAPDDGSR